MLLWILNIKQRSFSFHERGKYAKLSMCADNLLYITQTHCHIYTKNTLMPVLLYFLLCVNVLSYVIFL